MTRGSSADTTLSSQVYGYYSKPYFCADVIAFSGETLAHIESADIKPWDWLTHELPHDLFYEGGIVFFFLEEVDGIKKIQGSMNAAYRGIGFTESLKWPNDPSDGGSGTEQFGIVPYQTS